MDFIGRYEHKLEEKGRLSIPSKFRRGLGEKVVLSKGLDGCLFLYSSEKWAELIAKIRKARLIKKDVRALTRFLTYGATELRFDKLGRILVPEYLRKWAKLTDLAVVAGAMDRVEIWDRKRFEEYMAVVDRESEEIAERLAGGVEPEV